MSHDYHLYQKPGLVLETHRPNQVLVVGDERQGRLVSAGAPPVNELRVSAYFVMPPLPVNQPGRYNVLTVARGRPARGSGDPRMWNPARLAKEKGGVYVNGTYDAEEAAFEFRQNVGEDGPKLHGVKLSGFRPEEIAGRLLHLEVLASQDAFFAAVDSDDGDLDLTSDAQTGSTGRQNHPWGAPAEGHWYMWFGVGKDKDPRSLSFPAGFGISDVSITLAESPESLHHGLPYSGALDHLLGSSRPAPSANVADFLLGLAGDLNHESARAATRARLFGTWADAAKRWAERMGL